MNPVDSHHSYLFTVRVWSENIGNGQTEWRGKVCHVVTQEEHYFRDWGTLSTLLQSMLPTLAQAAERRPQASDAEVGSRS